MPTPAGHRAARPWLARLFQILFALALLALVAAIVGAATCPLAAGCPVGRVPAWAWLAALVPVAIVAQHALYVYIVRGSQLLDRRSRLSPFGGFLSATADPFTAVQARRADPPAPADADDDFARRFRPAVESSIDREFDGFVLCLRYGVSAAILLLALIGWLLLLREVPDIQLRVATDGREGDPLLSESLKSAAWIGLAGAYCYTLLQLGRRSFARDITSGIAGWCAITVVLGPLLAMLLTKLGLDAVAPIADPAAGEATAVEGLLLAVHFVAGFAPRYVIESIFEGVKKRTGYLSSANAVARGVPLTDVRGIVPEIAERLGEEGVLDVSGLALADPVRLLRNTAFDRRQVLGWIDESILIVTLPEHWQALEKLGITGAIDLAWCSCDDAGEPAARNEPPDPNQASPDPTIAPRLDPATPGCSPAITRLAAELHLDPCTLGDIAKRLFQDAQVGIVWALYQTHAPVAATGP